MNIKESLAEELTNVPYDVDCKLVSEDKRNVFLGAMRKIAELAVEKHFGELPVKVVEVYQSIKDEDEALFEEMINA